jgi:hypothetical protein
MQILNVSDATNITLVTELTNESSDYFSIHVKNEIAYISDIENGIHLINVSNITNPKEIVLYTYENCGTNDIFEQGETLFIADRNIGFLIFSMTESMKTTTTTTTTSTSDVTTTTNRTTTTTTPFSNIWVCILFGISGLFIKRKHYNAL